MLDVNFLTVTMCGVRVFLFALIRIENSRDLLLLFVNECSNNTRCLLGQQIDKSIYCEKVRRKKKKEIVFRVESPNVQRIVSQ